MPLKLSNLHTHTHMHTLWEFLRANEHISSPPLLPSECYSKRQKVEREKLIENLRLSSQTKENLALS